MNGNVKAGPESEWFDVVNAHDEVIGREPRAVVHAQGLWHRAVHVLVFNTAGAVFLQKRSLRKDVAPGLWDSSCSGHLDAGEDYDAAAWRELREELGLHLSAPPARWQRFAACAETGWEFVWTYRVMAAGPFVLHPEEIERGDWFAPVQASAWMEREPGAFSPAFRHIWGALMRDALAP